MLAEETPPQSVTPMGLERGSLWPPKTPSHQLPQCFREARSFQASPCLHEFPCLEYSCLAFKSLLRCSWTGTALLPVCASRVTFPVSAPGTPAVHSFISQTSVSLSGSGNLENQSSVIVWTGIPMGTCWSVQQAGHR